MSSPPLCAVPCKALRCPKSGERTRKWAANWRRTPCFHIQGNCPGALTLRTTSTPNGQAGGGVRRNADLHLQHSLWGDGGGDCRRNSTSKSAAPPLAQGIAGHVAYIFFAPPPPRGHSYVAFGHRYQSFASLITRCPPTQDHEAVQKRTRQSTETRRASALTYC